MLRGRGLRLDAPAKIKQIREEMKTKKKNLPQGKVTSVFLTFSLAGVLYNKGELIVLNIFYFFKENFFWSFFFFLFVSFLVIVLSLWLFFSVFFFCVCVCARMVE